MGANLWLARTEKLINYGTADPAPIFGYESWTDYRTIETPAMLLCGDGDFFVNQERIDYTCTLFPNCEVHPLIENAGAFIGLEQPEAFAEAIIEFLQRP
jgi:pimeloyl-ACP methyl ester carboxylesterase